MRRSTDVLSVWSSRRIECVGRSSLDWARHPTFHELNSVGLVRLMKSSTFGLGLSDRLVLTVPSSGPATCQLTQYRNLRYYEETYIFKYYLKAQKLKHRFFVLIKAPEMIERRVIHEPQFRTEFLLPFFEFSLKACFRFPKTGCFFIWFEKKWLKIFLFEKNASWYFHRKLHVVKQNLAMKVKLVE